MPLHSGGFKAKLELCLFVLFVLFLLFVLFVFFVLVAIVVSIGLGISPSGTEPQIAKLGCPDKCGNVSVPFPFGLKEGCYLNSSIGFFLNCSQYETLFFSPNSASYGSDQFRVSEIHTSGYLSVHTPVVRVYNNQIISKPIITSPEFPFDASNTFRVVGCDAVGIITISGHPYLCSTICTSETNLSQVSPPCLGVGCCQNSMIPGVWNYTIQLRRSRNHTKMAGKEYSGISAFLADESRDSSLTRINWAVKMVENESCIEARCEDSYAWKSKHASCQQTQNPIGYVCHCNFIFEGNPYLAGGCGILQEVEWISYFILAYGIPACSFVSAVILYRCWKKNKKNKREEMLFRQNGGYLLKDNLAIFQDNLSRFQKVTNPIRIFSANEMEEATNKFDDKNIIGHGGFGIVYKGYLPRLGTLAIKKSKPMNKSEIEIFINEVMLLSKIHNQNVVTFLGCCLEMDVPLLIFEFVNNGTLKSHLHDGTNPSRMPWVTRLKVAAETAGVLTYLHNNHRPPIIHRDVKPDNILLDEGFNAKVSDFGISRLVAQNESHIPKNESCIHRNESCIKTEIRGTFGYLDPEYYRTWELTEKSDVYSFGVLLVELITRKKLGSDEGTILVDKFGSLMKDNSVYGIIDQDIINDENVGQIMEAAQIANLCVREKGEDRPTMDEVAVRLKSLWAESRRSFARSSSTGSHIELVCY